MAGGSGKRGESDRSGGQAILVKYRPDKQEMATLTVLEQAELLCRNWAA